MKLGIKVISLVATITVLAVSMAANYRGQKLVEFLASPLVYVAGLHLFYAYLTGTRMYASGFISENAKDHPTSRMVFGWLGILTSGLVIYFLWVSNAQHT